jgi:chaperonin GroES
MHEKIEPVRDMVLVQPIDDPEKTTSGLLYVPKTAKAKEMRGKVLAVGPGRYLENGTKVPVSVDVGDTVLVMEYRLEVSTGFQSVGRSERPPVLIPDGDILAKIHEAPAEEQPDTTGITLASERAKAAEA